MSFAAITKEGLALLGISFALHVAIGQSRMIKQHIPALFGVFILPAILLMLHALLLRAGAARCQEIAASILDLSLAAAYVQTYPTIQYLPPTLRILRILRSADPAGLTQEKIALKFMPERVFLNALESLLAGKFVKEERPSGLLFITARGEALLAPFTFLRKVLSLPPGLG